MNNKFDELTKGLAQSVTRRAALKKFGVGLAGIALACFGLANKAEAKDCPGICRSHCSQYSPVGSTHYRLCYTQCMMGCRMA
jgi:hypothetical protein